MRRPPTLAALLAAASLAVPAAAFAQGAGDNQYQDPFGGGSSSGSGSVSSGSSGSGSSSGSSSSGSSSGSSSSGSGLSQDPNLGTSGTSGSAGTSSSSAATTSSSTGATGSAAALPNTGSDPRLLALAGLALLLFGAGLRLRTADERF